MKKFNFINSLIFGMILLMFTTTLMGSAENQITPLKYVYDIEDSNGIMTIWGVGSCNIEEGGTIEFIENGNYSSYGIEEMHYNITFKGSDNQINQTIGNYSSTNTAYAFILGFGFFQPSIRTQPNWTSLDDTAISVSNTPASALYSLNGTLEITSLDGIRTYDYEQNASLGNQKTFLEYQESTGILLCWQSSFFGYSLTARLNMTTSVLPENALENQGFSIPGYSSFSLIVMSAIIIPFLLSKRKK